MATLIELQAFQKMWTWLSAHPAHNQDYYMTHVARLDAPWPKSCPMCHTAGGSCNDCDPLWKSERGGLCDDQESPLNKWRQTSVEDPDNRTWFANRVAILSQQAVRLIQGAKH